MNRPAFALLVVVAAATSAGAQVNLKPRPLGPVLASTTESFAAITTVIPLGDGKILVDDARRRRLVLLDSSLSHAVVVGDASGAGGLTYPPRGGTLLPYVGDSAALLDISATSILILDSKGHVARTMSVPRSGDMFSLQRGARFDNAGHLFYRATPQRGMMRMLADGSVEPVPLPPTDPLLRVDLETRRVDTIGQLTGARPKPAAQSAATPGTVSLSVQPLFPLVDDWALLTDGSVAVLRGQDYRLDRILADGTTRAGEKIPFAWKRLSDDEKTAVVDSIMKARANAVGFGGSGAGGGGATIMSSGGSGGVIVSGGSAAAAGASAGGSSPQTINVAPPPPPSVDDVPDYLPPFRAGAMTVDPAGNVWVGTSQQGSGAASLVYDVISPEGKLIDRVEMPKNHSLAAFDRNGTLLLIHRELGVTSLVRAKSR